MRCHVPRWFPPAAVLVFAATSALPAQSPYATVRGVVVDASDRAVAEASLSIVSEDTGETRASASDAEGAFAIGALRPGAHRLEVSSPGYKKHVQHVQLRLGEELRTTVSLEVGSLSETVEVVGRGPTLRRESGAISLVLDNRLVTSLPLDGRNYLELTLLAPGAAPAAQGAAGAVRGDVTLNVNGARDEANGFLLDGVDNLDPKLNTAGVRPAVDAIREFEIRTSSYEASFGRQAGAQVNVVLKSGTNDLTGTAYEFYRGAFDARNHFAPVTGPSPVYERHQFGASLGGPVLQGRTFFFGNYEGTRRREGITRVSTVPTAAERAGDFSSSLLPPPLNPSTGTPFDGGRLPAPLIHPIGRALANLYPLPNLPGDRANYVSSPEERDVSDQFDVRVTHAWAPQVQSSIRYSFGDRRLFEPFSGPTFAAVPGFGTDVPRRAQHVMADLAYAGSSFTNELRMGFTRVAAGAFQENAGRNLNAQVGLPAPWTAARDQGLSFITISGFSPLGDEYNNPQHSATNAWQISDVLSWGRGRHFLRLGGDVRLLRQQAYRDVQARGFLSFASIPFFTGNALADALLGVPLLTGRARIDNRQALQTHNIGLFAQDSIRMSRDLTLSAGLRYEYASPAVDEDDRATVYDPVSAAIVRVGTEGVPRGAYDADRNNLAPRLGVTWLLPGAAGTILRAGYGLYYNQSPLAPSEGLYFSPPHYDIDFFTPLPGRLLTVDDPFPDAFPLAFPDSALAFDRHLRTPYLHQWNVGLQRGLGAATTIDVAYVGSRGRHLIASRDLNQPEASAAPVNPRPDPRFDDITLIESRARSRYHALQATVHRRHDSALTLLLAYTWSTSRDDASGFFSSAGDPNFPQDSRTPAAEWGRSGFDVRHRVTASFAYVLPFAREAAPGSWRGTLAAGWQLAGIVALQSGRPFTVALLPEIDNSNTGRASLGFGANDRPNVAKDASLSSPSSDAWFDTAAFTMPPFGTFGNAGRNILDGPGSAHVNLSILKDLPLTGTMRAQLRVETFNVLNRTNLDLPDAFLGSATFGRILSAQAPRRVQLGVKVLF
jgi:hypothetical protein